MVLLGREELINREHHFAEQIAGFVSGFRAVLGGNAEVIDRNQHLDIADKLNDGEDSKRYIDSLAVVGIHKASAEVVGNSLRDGIASAVAVAFAFAAFTRLDDAGGQHDGLGNLNLANRQVAGYRLLAVRIVLAELAAEYFDIAFAAEKYYTFAEYADTAKLGGRAVAAGEGFDLDIEEKGEIAGKVAAVERKWLDVDESRDDAGFFRAYADGAVNNHLFTLGKVYSKILKTIFIRA